jgi:hypothetical protein
MVTAVAVTLVATLVPVDVAADRSAKSWVRFKWLKYRLKLALLQVVATVIVALAAPQIGWGLTSHASRWAAVVRGVSWSVAAVAVLRAEVTSSRVEAASPGFSVLRSFSGWFTATLKGAIEDAVRKEYGNKTLVEIRKASLEAVARIDKPQQDGSPTPAQISIGSQIESYSPTSDRDLALCRQLVTTLVVDFNLTRLT